MTEDYSTIQVKEIRCPFCKDGIIKAHHRPSFKCFKKSRSAAGVKLVPCASKEKWNILTNCPKCGKSSSEIEKALKQGVAPSKEDVIARMRAAGIDPTKV